MCSTGGRQLARLCLAIEELADAAASGDGTTARSRDGRDSGATNGMATASGSAHNTATASGTADSPAAGCEHADGAATDSGVTARLAALWAMVAEADPEMARRLPGYLSAAE
jgi:hypothetical protein